MGTLGTKFDSGDISLFDRMSRKSLTVDTGTNLAALNPTYEGQLIFCTSTGGGLTSGRLYYRNEINTTWIEVLYLTEGQLISNKTISDSNNTISNIGSTSINSSALTAVKLISALNKVSFVNSSATFNTTSTSYVDVTSMSVTITANGSRAGMITEYVTSIDHSDEGHVIITDTSNNIKAHVFGHQNLGTYTGKTISVVACETAPSSGSITRKVRTKQLGSDIDHNQDLTTNGRAMYIMEIV